MLRTGFSNNFYFAFLGNVAVGACLTLAPAAFAVDAIWDGSTGNWSNPLKWSTNPEIANNGAVTYDAFVAAGNLTQDVVGGVIIDQLNWSGGRIYGSQPITVLESAAWSNGGLFNSGGLIIGEDATLTYTGNSTQHMLGDNSVLEVVGEFLMTGSAILNAGALPGSGATVNVQTGGLFDVQDDSDLSDTFFNSTSQVRDATINNSGTFRKSTGTSVSLLTDDWTFVNTSGGLLEVLSGTLNFSQDGDGFANDGLADVQGGVLQIGGGVSTGDFQVAAGGTLRFTTRESQPNLYHDLNGASIDSAGMVEINGRVRFNSGTTLVGNQAALLTGNGAEIAGTAPLALQSLTWSGGTLANSGGVSIPSAATLAINGAGVKRLAAGAVLTIDGQATLSGSQNIENRAPAGMGSRVEIGSTGVLDMQGDLGFTESLLGKGNNAGILAIDGILRKSSGTGTSQVSVDWSIENTGRIEVQAGTLRVLGDLSHDGVVDLSGGDAEFHGVVSGPGTFTGSGEARFYDEYFPGASAAQIAFAGDVALTVGQSELHIDIGGTSIGSQFDALSVAGTASLGGTLRVNLIDLGGGTTFSPTIGNVFPVISAGEIVGDFFKKVLPPLTAGLSWQIVRTDTDYSLLVTTTSPVVTTGDYNGDLVVNAADYTVWRNMLGESVELGEGADGDKNGIVDFEDYLFWKGHFGDTVGSGAIQADFQAVPEPAGATLLLAGLAAVALCRRIPNSMALRI